MVIGGWSHPTQAIPQHYRQLLSFGNSFELVCVCACFLHDSSVWLCWDLLNWIHFQFAILFASVQPLSFALSFLSAMFPIIYSEILYEIAHSMQSISELVECNPGNLLSPFFQSRELYSSIAATFSTALGSKKKIINFITICCFHAINVVNNHYWPQYTGS